MDVFEALSSRYSVRGYRPDPVPEETIREVFDYARLAPSNTNMQPWHVAVASGAVREQLSNSLCAAFDGGETDERDFETETGRVPDVYMDRRRHCGYTYYGVMGVERDDRAGRTAIARKNYELFGAPHAAIFSMPKTMGFSNALDVGLFMQSVMLLFHERGIGCIAQGALAFYPTIVRRHLPIPEENGILCGMSFGFEDKDALINTVRMPREPLNVVAEFVS